MLQILDPKIGFQVKYETQKHCTHTPVYKYGKYPPGVLSILIKVCSVNFEPPTRVPLNKCSPSAIMALSFENDIFMAWSYKQTLLKIAQ